MMKLIRFALLSLAFVLSGTAFGQSSFPIKILCSGEWALLSILINEKQILMPNQTFNFESQKGTLRRYKDSDTKQIFIYDIVSGRVHIGEETGMSIPGLNEMINANCKKS